MMRHVERVHTDQNQTFNCKECGKKLKNQYSLLRHAKTYHSGREPIKCSHCDKSFFEERMLQKHFSDVHDKRKPFYCDICQFQCARLSNLNLHRAKSHNRQDKLTKLMLISMVENDQHPFYTRDDLPMILKLSCH